MSCLMVMAGGTGGHVFPALAVADRLSQQGVKIVWLGTEKGIESRVVPKAGYETHWISVQGLRGNGLQRWVLAPFTLLRAIYQSLSIIRKVKPACVLGMGGFASGPGGIAASLLGKPLIVHEQNAVAGLTNKWLAKIAKTVLTGFRGTKGLPESAIWVGNPVRAEIAVNDLSVVPSNSKRILVLGGSQGANSLNLKLPEILSKLSMKQSLEIWHQAGRTKLEAVDELYANSSANDLKYKVDEFIDDIAVAYTWADIIICRSGAMTVTEIMAVGKPAVFVPYPYAAGDHQTLNAQSMVDEGAAILINDAEIENASFKKELAVLIRDKDRLIKMGKNAKQLFRAKATEQTAEICMEWLSA